MYIPRIFKIILTCDHSHDRKMVSAIKKIRNEVITIW